jgi:hypothetical protein
MAEDKKPSERKAYTPPTGKTDDPRGFTHCPKCQGAVMHFSRRHMPLDPLSGVTHKWCENKQCDWTWCSLHGSVVFEKWGKSSEKACVTCREHVEDMWITGQQKFRAEPPATYREYLNGKTPKPVDNDKYAMSQWSHWYRWNHPFYKDYYQDYPQDGERRPWSAEYFKGLFKPLISPRDEDTTMTDSETGEVIEVSDTPTSDDPFVVMYLEAVCPKCRKEPNYETMTNGRVRLVFTCGCEGATDAFEPDQTAMAFCKAKCFSKRE